MRIELFASAAAFGAGSLYWLLAARQMDASAYGAMMRIQAGILICTGLFSCRTYDLVFFLQRRFGWDLHRAFRLAFRIEVVLSTFAAPLAAATSLLSIGGTSRISVVLTAGLCTFGVLQGSSQALLRGLRRDRAITRADLASCLAYVCAVAALFSTRSLDPLTIWALAFAVRPLVLLAEAWTAMPAASPAAPDALKREYRSEVTRFLVHGQLTNLLKNNAIAIETLLLGRFANNSTVALFRIARALLNFSTVFLNIVYQRGFRELADASIPTNRRGILSAINRRSLGVWLLALPVVLVAAVVFSTISADPAYDRLLVVTLLLALAMAPTVLQQGQFAALSVSGRFSRITVSYAVGLSVLAISCLAVHEPLSIESFIGLLLAANLSRYGMLRWAGREAAQ